MKNDPCSSVHRASNARQEFEAAYGRQLKWNPLEGHNACRISESSDGDVQNEAEHEKYIEFFMEAGERFRCAISAVNGSSSIACSSKRWPHVRLSHVSWASRTTEYLCDVTPAGTTAFAAGRLGLSPPGRGVC